MSRDIQNKAARLFASSVLSGTMNSALATVLVSVGSCERNGHEKDCDKHPLYFFRRARGWTGAELAKAAGVSQGCISQYELGQKTPHIDIAFRLALALETTVDRLFGIPYKRNAREELAAR